MGLHTPPVDVLAHCSLGLQSVSKVQQSGSGGVFLQLPTRLTQFMSQLQIMPPTHVPSVQSPSE